MRLAARTVLRTGDDEKDAKDAKEAKGSGPESHGGFDFGDGEDKAQAKYASSDSASAAGSKHQQQQAKPAWAMTEKAADNQFEDLLMNEEDDLLDFAKGLDFDKYMGDIEVQTVMERLRKRIADLERDVALEDSRNSDAETRAAMRAKLEQMVSKKQRFGCHCSVN